MAPPKCPSTPAAPQPAGERPPPGGDRRASGRRARSRDRLMDRATRAYPQTDPVSKANNAANLVMFIDDDLRESALALARIEAYLVDTLGMLESEEIVGGEVRALATDVGVLDHVDMLAETLENLRRRMARLAASLRE